MPFRVASIEFPHQRFAPIASRLHYLRASVSQIQYYHFISLNKAQTLIQMLCGLSRHKEERINIAL
jgi:hypothetical protein